MNERLIRDILAGLGLTVVRKEPRAKPTGDRTPRIKHSAILQLAPGEVPVARIATYHSQRCSCCGETETYFAGTYIRTSYSRWHAERFVLASMPHADVAHLPLEISESGDPVSIPACFRCAATALIVDRALADAQHTTPTPGQLPLFS